MARARLHLIVAGLVQGVAFRACAAEEARRLGLSGWVRTLPDGRVEAEAEGDGAALEAFLAWCRRGPPAARVSGVEAAFGEAGPGGPPGFEIRR